MGEHGESVPMTAGSIVCGLMMGEWVENEQEE